MYIYICIFFEEVGLCVLLLLMCDSFFGLKADSPISMNLGLKADSPLPCLVADYVPYILTDKYIDIYICVYLDSWRRRRRRWRCI